MRTAPPSPSGERTPERRVLCSQATHTDTTTHCLTDCTAHQRMCSPHLPTSLSLYVNFPDACLLESNIRPDEGKRQKKTTTTTTSSSSSFANNPPNNKQAPQKPKLHLPPLLTLSVLYDGQKEGMGRDGGERFTQLHITSPVRQCFACFSSFRLVPGLFLLAANACVLACLLACLRRRCNFH